MARTDPRPTFGSGRAMHSEGYVRVHRPGHPLAHSDGYVLEHRLVLHEAGIELGDKCVHHVNGNPADNRIENLELVDSVEHTREHNKERGIAQNQWGAWPLPKDPEARRQARLRRKREWRERNRERINEYKRRRYHASRG